MCGWRPDQPPWEVPFEILVRNRHAKAGETVTIGERLKGSGMRWVEEGAATVAALRALYVSGSKLWDGLWARPHRPAA